MTEFALALEAERLRSENRMLTQALWQVYSLVGGDTDGDPTPAALLSGMGVAGYINAVLEEVQYHIEVDEEGE